VCGDHELGLQVEGVEQLDLARRVGARVRQETVVTDIRHSAVSSTILYRYGISTVVLEPGYARKQLSLIYAIPAHSSTILYRYGISTVVLEPGYARKQLSLIYAIPAYSSTILYRYMVSTVMLEPGYARKQLSLIYAIQLFFIYMI
jgi:hypothetical protein